MSEDVDNEIDDGDRVESWSTAKAAIQ